MGPRGGPLLGAPFPGMPFSSSIGCDEKLEGRGVIGAVGTGLDAGIAGEEPAGCP